VKDPVTILQEAGWAPGLVWTAENLARSGFFFIFIQEKASFLLNESVALLIVVRALSAFIRSINMSPHSQAANPKGHA